LVPVKVIEVLGHSLRDSSVILKLGYRSAAWSLVEKLSAECTRFNEEGFDSNGFNFFGQRFRSI
jgi:hypothetical protein